MSNQLQVESHAVVALPRASWQDYVSIARPDHWIKHVFVLPGVILAMMLGADPVFNLTIVLSGFLVAAMISSANYVINEWLDAEFDAHHPTKSARPAVTKLLSGRMVLVEYLLLSITGLVIAYSISTYLFVVASLFVLSGWTYNLTPVRTKNKAYLDVATEALNNPIRLALGWALIDMATIPPSSLMIAYWAGGAFLMSTKRFAEYRSVSATDGVDVLHLYRSSFRQYTETRLLLQSFLYAQIACFFIAVFLIKYRIEYIISFPLFASLFTTYLWVGLKQGSVTQTPEKLFSEKGLMLVVGMIVMLLTLLSIIDLPWLNFLSEPHLLKVQ